MPPRTIEHYDPSILFRDGWHFMVFAPRTSIENAGDVLNRAMVSIETLEEVGHKPIIVQLSGASYLVGIGPDLDDIFG